ncbi:hypothetical protein MATL_G00079340 [Megalops atlanticus]|uniref:RHD domain-containing protein n=1 Tax=Megalops atlanticus TaxID=7932 RepID=A0A9D3Q5N7_MEGAT|nr:hypothetical protein MATL_G00079340 [Megalops atlanticus]
MTSICEDKDPNSLGITGDLSQVNQDELDFSELFVYPGCNDFPGEDQDEPSLPSQKVLNPTTGMAYPHEDMSAYTQSCSPSLYREPLPDDLTGYEQLENKNYLDHSRPGGPAMSPRIEITPTCEHYQHVRDCMQAQPVNIIPRPSLTVPGHEGPSYRELPCLSPASSNSSTSCHSEGLSPWASPCVSPSSVHTPADLCPRLQNIHTSSPRTSPGTSPRTSVTEDSYLGARPSPHGGYEDHHHHHAGQYGLSSGLAEAMNGLNTGLPGSIPTKIIKPNLDYWPSPETQADSCLFSCEQDVKSKPGAEPYFVIPPIWPNQLISGHCSIPAASLPSLEWPVPSRNDQYELRIEMQPKPHHRAHYETEGSRGAVKAPNGGHPVVQLLGYRGKDPLGLQIFIGTADERILKPHAFYQVHRITGKTVTTTSYEKMIHNTKVLEIPLEPKNNMRAVIDCAGILKLKNADIELRKGETDIGRKNTRVRLVFRIHIPQAGGQPVSLQVASHPIECSQRSAHELPMVEKQDMDSCSVLGGQQMILTGQNFTSDSKVVFTEKTHDGQHIWDVEATVDKDKSQANMLFVEVPPYRDPSVCHSVKVNFYVINGKRKRSQPQHFTYTPLAVPSIKTEPLDDYQSGQMGYAVSQILGISPQSYYHGPRGLVNPDSCLATGMASCQQVHSGLPPDPLYQQQNPTIVYPRGGKSLGGSPLLYQQHGGMVVHGTSPSEPPHMGGHQLSTSPGQHSSSSPSSSIIHFSPTNHLLRAGAPPPPSTSASCTVTPPPSPTTLSSSSSPTRPRCLEAGLRPGAGPRPGRATAPGSPPQVTRDPPHLVELPLSRRTLTRPTWMMLMKS